MKNLKKIIFVLGAIVISILLVSTVTAVEQVSSRPANYIESMEQASVISYEEIQEYLEEQIGEDELENFIENFEIEDILTSDDFIGFMNSPEAYNLIYGDEFLTLYNTNAIQDFVSSDVFMEFFYSDACQYFLSQLNIGDEESTTFESENLQTVTLNEETSTLVSTTSSFEETVVFVGIEESLSVPSVSEEEPPQPTGIFLAFAGLIIGFIAGVILWIPGAIVCIGLLSAFGLMCWWLMITSGTPGGVLYFLGYTMLGIGLAIVFPLLAAIFGALQGWVIIPWG